jgi:hypothetical protein
VAFAVRSPHHANFSADVMAGGKLELGINALVGPPPTDTWVAFGPDIHRVTIEHKDMPPVAHPAGGTVRRQYVEISIGSKDRGGAISYHQGTYEVRITAAAGTVIYVKTELKAWHPKGLAVLRLNDQNQDGTPAHTGIVWSSEQSIFDPGGRHCTASPSPPTPTTPTTTFPRRPSRKGRLEGRCATSPIRHWVRSPPSRTSPHPATTSRRR